MLGISKRKHAHSHTMWTTFTLLIDLCCCLAQRQLDTKIFLCDQDCYRIQRAGRNNTARYINQHISAPHQYQNVAKNPDPPSYDIVMRCREIYATLALALAGYLLLRLALSLASNFCVEVRSPLFTAWRRSCSFPMMLQCSGASFSSRDTPNSGYGGYTSQSHILAPMGTPPPSVPPSSSPSRERRRLAAG